MLKQEQIHSITLNQIDENWVVSMVFEENNEVTVFEFTIEDKKQFVELKKRLTAQLPNVSNKMTVQN